MHAVYGADVNFVSVDHGQDLPIAAAILRHASEVGAPVHVATLQLHEALLLTDGELGTVPQDDLLHRHPGLTASIVAKEVLKHLLSGLLLLL